VSVSFSKKNIIAIAMSGGVDSSTVAAIMLSEGYEVFGLTMNFHKSAQNDIEDSAKICKILGISHFVVDFKNEFHEKVIKTFRTYYENGMTPNPCALCNRYIKIGLLVKEAIDKGANFLATGHYVKRTETSLLSEATNKSKDQSYFLALAKKENLKRMMFPLGDMKSKNETREIAQKYGLHNFEKKESQDMCFAHDESYFPENIGEIIHIRTGEILGKHSGIHNYTIGQRKGLSVSYKNPLYVIRIDCKRNSILVGEKELLNRKNFVIRKINWIIEKEQEFKIHVKLRSSCKKTLAKVQKLDNSSANVELLENTDTPVANGQICAMYDGECVVGGGIIWEE
jgi:tRNA-specific 2-thiouridylase